MPPSKGLTRATRLRMTEEERDLLVKAQEVYAQQGVRLSQNDMLRHLIRRAGIVLACTPDEAEEQIRTHSADCPLCDFDVEQHRCPEGLYLYRNLRRVVRAHAMSDATTQL